MRIGSGDIGSFASGADEIEEAGIIYNPTQTDNLSDVASLPITATNLNSPNGVIYSKEKVPQINQDL